MLNNIFKRETFTITRIAKILFCSLFFIMSTFSFAAFAENIGLSFTYGINNVAKNGKELPIEITIENKDTQDFNGEIHINTYESNSSVYIYKLDLSIEKLSTAIKNENISITNKINTIIVEIYNSKEELVSSERTSVDLSYYDDKLIVGALTKDFQSLSYIDGLPLYNNTLSVKLVEVTEDAYNRNKNILDCIDILLVADVDIDEYGDSFIQAINSYFDNGNALNLDSSLQKGSDEKKAMADLLEQTFGKNKLERLVGKDKILTFNDYYNISNLLNIIDKLKLPDIFILTIALVFYIMFITVILYVFLRNINMRQLYGRLAFFTAIIFTIIMLAFGYSSMKRSTFLTYISVVDINGASTKEKAFLNFRTSENGSYAFNTSATNKIYPILRNTREPIISLDFMDTKGIKTTEIYKKDDRTNISVDNAKDFDSNIFLYENSNYLNDVYNVTCQVTRFDGEITGRVTNNMNVPINNANILMYGKIQKIGDIDANRSISLSRTESIGAPIGNNSMLSEMLSGDSNNANIIKYYLDENVYGYYNYALLFGFIDNNGTLDLNSSDVGDVYGKTLIVTKISIDDNENFKDLCSLENDVNNIYGYYNFTNNSTNGDTEVINEYHFNNKYVLSKIYFEDLYNFDHGKLDSNVPFYGEISVYNISTGNYDLIHNKVIPYNDISNYITANNSIVIKFNPSSKDPLYRYMSLPVIRAIASEIK